MLDREALIAICNTYIQKGLVEHEPSEVLFAEGCRRLEMGIETGSNAAQLREILMDESYRSIEGVRDAHWVVEAPYVDVFYRMDFAGSEEGARIATRFLVEDGAIARIEILFYGGAMNEAMVTSLQRLKSAT